jgi:hypothetical protein
MADRDNYRGYGSPSDRYYEAREYRGSRDQGREDWRGRDDRGFFERTGDEIRSWFGDDNSRDRHHRDDWHGQSRDQDRGHGRTSEMGGRDRDFRQDASEPWGGGDRGGRYEDRGGYGRGTGGMGSADWRGQEYHPQDDHYRDWRRQQMDSLDRDYDEYRRENRDKFHSDFSNWRENRQQQRSSMRSVREHMEVCGSEGTHLGTVDKVSGDRIILTKSDPAAGGHHHSIPCSWIQSVDDKVIINKTADQAKDQWRDEQNRRALFESEDQRRGEGAHVLNRSFSGTYEERR